MTLYQCRIDYRYYGFRLLTTRIARLSTKTVPSVKVTFFRRNFLMVGKTFSVRGITRRTWKQTDSFMKSNSKYKSHMRNHSTKLRFAQIYINAYMFA